MANNKPPIHLQSMRFVSNVLNGRSALSKAIPPALLVVDAVLCALIIWKIPYTEIDWKAYMQQVAQYLGGELDYSKIEGDTGPLVYPAAHVYIYTSLYHLTDHGKDIFLAQQLFAGLYLVTLALVMFCYWRAKAPPYVFPMLILSKRLHSIFMLRCFNDCFAVFFLWLSIFYLQRRSWSMGALAYSLGLGVKMTLLLILPNIGIILLLSTGPLPAIARAFQMLQLQLGIAFQFLLFSPRAYLGKAFEFSRQFNFKWTVNWRFVGEETFLSREFSVALLVLHVSVLLTFIFTRWLPPSGKSLPDIVRAVFSREGAFRPIYSGFSSTYIMSTVLTANVIGLLFARSLHYQFYAYLAWSTPFLLWRSGLHPVLQYVLWGLQEWAWNVFPSTPISSVVVVGVMVVTVAAVWIGTGDEVAPPAAKSKPTQDVAR